jgi:hypothetical protein
MEVADGVKTGDWPKVMVCWRRQFVARANPRKREKRGLAGACRAEGAGGDTGVGERARVWGRVE